jgi:hypothetical protein
MLLIYIARTMNAYFPDLKQELSKIPDKRVKPYYSIEDVVFSAVGMFLFKSGSRNSVNENRLEGDFIKNYRRIFKYKLPHMDTMDGVLKKIDPLKLEQLNFSVVSTLINRRFLHKKRLLGKYFVVSIDGVKISTANEDDEGTLKKVSKNGVETYSRECLQAKITVSDGFSIPILTEWIATEDGAKKQDCELNAFKRLAVKLAVFFPKTRICLIFDGLYANASIFEIARLHAWKYIITLKNKSLKTLWREIREILLNNLYAIDSLFPPSDTGVIYNDIDVPHIPKQTIDTIERTLEWCNNLKHQEHSLNWFSCREKTPELSSIQDEVYYAWITNFELNNSNIIELEKAVRTGRAGIEDSFNTEKNRGYKMKHKYSRKSFRAAKNYLTCMHIAETINQLVVLSRWFQSNLLVTDKSSIYKLWEKLAAKCETITDKTINEILNIMPKTYSYR